MLAADPALSVTQVRGALAAVSGHGAVLRSLHEAFRADPAVLRLGAPPAVGRLITALRAAGASWLAEPACTRCYRVGFKLTRTGPGALCPRCRTRVLAQECLHCKVIKPVAARDSGGRAICARCAERPRRICGRCGRSRPIARRAHDGEPDICDRCFQLPAARCSRCGRHRPCSFASGPAPVCVGCAPRRTTACARCTLVAPVTALWADGPVCDRCYNAALRARGTCAGCQLTRRLVSPAGTNPTTCADCAGLPVTHACTDCGLEDKLYQRGHCERCALRHRATALLGDAHEQIPDRLLGVHQAIITTATPRTALNWLRGGAGAALLREVATGQLPCTHSALDTHPRPHAADYLRHMLIAGGALPERDEALARLERWVTALITDHPHPEHRRLLHAYATWRLLRRLRRGTAITAPARTPTSYPRNQLLAAQRFLTWLNENGLTLRQCQQADVDRWLLRSPGGYSVRDFLLWAAEHQHSPTLHIPAPSRNSGPATDSDQRWALLARLLHDDTLDRTDRVAGAILLCYGQQLSRIAVITTDQIHRHHDHVTLRLGTSEITVPEPLAGLLTDLIHHGRRHQGIGTPTQPSQWLFPGHLPGRPITGSRLGERLRHLGIRALPGRRATLLQLAAEIPAAVLADLLHLHPGTATHWTRAAGGDWSRYAASIALNQPTSTPAE